MRVIQRRDGRSIRRNVNQRNAARATRGPRMKIFRSSQLRVIPFKRECHASPKTWWVFAQKLRPDFSRRKSFDQLKDAVSNYELRAEITRSIRIENGVMERAGGKNYLSFSVEFLTDGQSIDRFKESPTLLSSFLIDVHATRVRCAIRNAHMHAAPCHPRNWDNADELHCGSLVVFSAKTPYREERMVITILFYPDKQIYREVDFAKNKRPFPSRCREFVNNRTKEVNNGSL